MSHYLGLDSSTQSLSAMIVDTATGRVVTDETVNFGTDLPAYKCPNGFLEHPDPLVKHSDPCLWAAALDLLLRRLVDRGADLGAVAGISGSGQQHGSVYLNERWQSVLPWQPTTDLATQIKPCLSRATAPIWMDSSTSAECAEIAAAVGGDDAVTRISGSRAIERFTGPQIRKFAKEEPEAYASTARIHLVSSFLASILAGQDAPIDYGDGAGMNLLDLGARDWSPELLAATAPALAERLPPAVPSSTVIGTIANYFVDTYGFASGTPVIAWSGDNPNSLVGMGAIEPGVAVISLGTSDTCFAAMSEPRTDPRGYGHVFGNPAGGFMCLICFKNGSLAREEVLRRFNLSWEAFSSAILEETTPGNEGRLMLPYFVPEITPRVLEPGARLFGDDAFCNWQNAPAAVRAIVEAQAVSMKLHADWIGERPETILVTGGASRNRGILQVLADVFQARIQRLPVTNSAALGAALRAANAAGAESWEQLIAAFAAPDPEVVEPGPDTTAIYADFEARFRRRLAESYGPAAP